MCPWSISALVSIGWREVGYHPKRGMPLTTTELTLSRSIPLSFFPKNSIVSCPWIRLLACFNRMTRLLFSLCHSKRWACVCVEEAVAFGIQGRFWAKLHDTDKKELSGTSKRWLRWGSIGVMCRTSMDRLCLGEWVNVVLRGFMMISLSLFCHSKVGLQVWMSTRHDGTVRWMRSITIYRMTEKDQRGGGSAVWTQIMSLSVVMAYCQLNVTHYVMDMRIVWTSCFFCKRDEMNRIHGGSKALFCIDFTDKRET